MAHSIPSIHLFIYLTTYAFFKSSNYFRVHHVPTCLDPSGIYIALPALCLSVFRSWHHSCPGLLCLCPWHQSGKYTEESSMDAYEIGLGLWTHSRWSRMKEEAYGTHRSTLTAVASSRPWGLRSHRSAQQGRSKAPSCAAGGFPRGLPGEAGFPATPPTHKMSLP